MQKTSDTSPDAATAILSLGFDHYERYAITRAIVEVIRGHLTRQPLSVLDVGGAPGSLPRFLPAGRVLSADLLDAHIPGYLRADGTALPFRDGVFDIVTCHDTLEHVPRDHREAFLLELLRVAAEFVIVNGPFYDPKVEAAERLVMQIAQDTVENDHPTVHFLREHIELGLPRLEETLALIDRLGFLHAVIPNGPLDEWLVKMMIKHHLLTLDAYGLHSDEFDRWSNQAYIPTRSTGLSYRQAAVISKHNDERPFQLIQEKLQPCSPSEIVGSDAFVSLGTVNNSMARYSTLLRELLQDKDQHIANIGTFLAERDALLVEKDAALADKDRHIAHVEATLNTVEEQLGAIRGSFGYRLLERARRVIRWLFPPGSWRGAPYRALIRPISWLVNRR